MTQALAPGARVGSYEVIDRLGAGGMGEVYRARDTRLGRTVALKVLRKDADPELLRRLDREARAASALSHPNIVQIYDVGVAAGEAGEHYVVMECVEGETLRRRLARGPLPIPELLDLGAQLTDGLARAHRGGVLHRDLKPENLVVTPEGLLKILDFGLAKLTPAAPRGRRRPGDAHAARHAGRHAARHARVHVARAGQRAPRRRPGGPVRGRAHPQRDGHRAARLPPRHPGPGPGRGDRARGGAAPPPAPGRPRGPRRGRLAVPAEGPGAALREDGRARVAALRSRRPLPRGLARRGAARLRPRPARDLGGDRPRPLALPVPRPDRHRPRGVGPRQGEALRRGDARPRDPRRQADRRRARPAGRRGALAAAVREPRLPPRGPDRGRPPAGGALARAPRRGRALQRVLPRLRHHVRHRRGTSPSGWGSGARSWPCRR